jgi:HSP20 family molecular chaperone IbpA
MNDTDHHTSPDIQVIGRTTHVRFHFHQVSVSTRSSLSAGTPHWVPSIDLYETEHEIVLEVCLAGVPSDEIHIQFTGREVHLSGTRREAAEEGPRSYCVMEIERGRFLRSIELPASILPDSVRASFADGLLSLRATKRSGSMHGCRRAQTREGLE